MIPALNSPKTKEASSALRLQLSEGITHSNAPSIVQKLGAHVQGHSAQFLIWHPGFKKAKKAFIHIYIPDPNLVFDKPDQHCTVTYFKFETAIIEEFATVVVDHLPAGNKDQFGAFYEFTFVDENEELKTVRDPMAWSLPYGIHAPAELYDIETVLADRKDDEYFRNLKTEADKSAFGRVQPSTNLLEIHPGTATLEGSLGSLAQRYKQIAAAVKDERELAPDEQNLLGFDGIQLMPVDPVIEHPEKHRFWKPIQSPLENNSEITVHLRKPSVINWGYDIAIFGSAAVNPSILSNGRPHELLDLIETLHTFPGGPIKLVLDVVYGHSDNQGLTVLPEEFFAGPNMYGQNINFKNPLVRAMLLEMQRRKINWGFDGIRVDGAQDFKYYDAEQDIMLHDDDFLKQMSAVEQNAAGIDYKPWMIFEDGRPWPRDDWELASTYRVVTEQQKHPHQWGPMIFAYNTPYIYTYWVSKWWRLKEQFVFGEKWISGYANHDTMRRGTQTDPSTINVNFLLGNSLKMVMDNAYNNPSTTLLMNGFLPGVPMDFIQSLGNTPWSFMRNTDTTYAIKVAAEEAYFTEWQISEVEYRKSRFFKNLKNMGFKTLQDLRRFAKVLLNLLKATDYNPENMAQLLNAIEPPLPITGWTIEKLHQYALAWMEDTNEYSNVDLHAEFVDAKKAAYNLSVRKYRLENPWLNKNFGESDSLQYREPVNGTVIYYGYRRSEEAGKEIAFVANMEGQPRQVIPFELNLPIKNTGDWNVALATPSVRAKKIDRPIRLSISQGILFERNL
jgi:1,4-alpha-glucan branching enzyme